MNSSFTEAYGIRHQQEETWDSDDDEEEVSFLSNGGGAAARSHASSSKASSSRAEGGDREVIDLLDETMQFVQEPPTLPGDDPEAFHAIPPLSRSGTDDTNGRGAAAAPLDVYDDTGRNNDNIRDMKRSIVDWTRAGIVFGFYLWCTTWMDSLREPFFEAKLLGVVALCYLATVPIESSLKKEALFIHILFSRKTFWLVTYIVVWVSFLLGVSALVGAIYALFGPSLANEDEKILREQDQLAKAAARSGGGIVLGSGSGRGGARSVVGLKKQPPTTAGLVMDDPPRQLRRGKLEFIDLSLDVKHDMDFPEDLAAAMRQRDKDKKKAEREESKAMLAKQKQEKAERLKAERAKAEYERQKKIQADQARALMEKAKAEHEKAERALAEQQARMAKAEKGRKEQQAKQAQLEKEKAEQAKAKAEQLAKAKAEQQAKQAKLEKEKAEQAKAKAEEQARAEAERKARQARLEKEKAEQAKARAEELARAEAERKARQARLEQAKAEQAKARAEEQARVEAERKARQARLEKEKAEQAKAKAEQLAKAKADQLEKQAKLEQERAEQAKAKAEEQARAKAERLAKQQAKAKQAEDAIKMSSSFFGILSSGNVDEQPVPTAPIFAISKPAEPTAEKKRLGSPKKTNVEDGKAFKMRLGGTVVSSPDRPKDLKKKLPPTSTNVETTTATSAPLLSSVSGSEPTTGLAASAPILSSLSGSSMPPEPFYFKGERTHVLNYESLGSTSSSLFHDKVRMGTAPTMQLRRPVQRRNWLQSLIHHFATFFFGTSPNGFNPHQEMLDRVAASWYTPMWR